MRTLAVPSRFNGPPKSGNGGYLAGLIAAQLPNTLPVTVILRSPPPLDTPLRLRGESLHHEDTLVAEWHAGEFARDAPIGVSHTRATAASAHYEGLAVSMYDTCFVCGSSRVDGLRIGPGRIGPDRVAAPWVPDDSLSMGPEIVWAAMDCPGGWSLPGLLERPALLGSMTATVHGLPAIGESCVVIGEKHSEQGRKAVAATALYGADGRLLGRAEQVWIRINRI